MSFQQLLGFAMKLFFSIFLAAALSIGATSAARAESYAQLVSRLGNAGGFQSSVEQMLLGKLNAFRASKGLHRLSADGTFTNAARAHALDMAQRGYLGHSSASGLDFSGRMLSLHVQQDQLSTMGENAVMMYPANSASKVASVLFNSWLRSPHHVDNMLRRDFTKVSTGAVFLNGKAYADQIFSGPLVVHQKLNSSGQGLRFWQ